jgi:hypothetical protein
LARHQQQPLRLPLFRGVIRAVQGEAGEGEGEVGGEDEGENERWKAGMRGEEGNGAFLQLFYSFILFIYLYGV